MSDLDHLEEIDLSVRPEGSALSIRARKRGVKAKLAKMHSRPKWKRQLVKARSDANRNKFEAVRQ